MSLQAAYNDVNILTKAAAHQHSLSSESSQRLESASQTYQVPRQGQYQQQAQKDVYSRTNAIKAYSKSDHYMTAGSNDGKLTPTTNGRTSAGSSKTNLATLVNSSPSPKPS